jgi:hypothetical protein
MASSTTPPYSAMSEHSSVKGTPTHIREWLMSLQQDSHASPFPLQESKPEQTIAETCGPKPSQYFASYNHDSRTWRTSQVCLLTNTLDEYSETWPKAGLMLDGVCYPQPSAVRPIKGNAYGYLLPTPAAQDWKDANCPSEHNLWPTASASDWKGSSKAGQRRGQLTDPAMGVIQAGGKLNPTFVEWLMGWPLGWTDLKPLEMDKFQQWQQQHGIC